MITWLRVSKTNPCPICHKPDWCGYSETTVCCMRVQSDRPVKNGGWIHRLADPVEYRPRKEPPRDHLIRPCFDQLWRGWRAKTEPVLLFDYSRALGVFDQALHDLGAAWAPEYGAWAFPMRDGTGKIDGIRLRADSGRKWAVTGSHQGVFITGTWPSVPDVALICEGPTDTAAVLTLGFLAIGRPSCLGCEVEIAATIKRLAIRRVVIVADNDGPGKTGAAKLAAGLRIPNKTIIPPAKDFRDWVRAGASKALVDCIINQQIWRIP